jgi:hypothetical protein
VLQSLPTDGMEWYNVHGNFIALLGGQGDLVGGGVDLPHLQQLVDALKSLEPFLLGGQGAADLAYLPLLKAHFPEVGLAKWHEVLGARFIAAGFGNDVHRNVSVKPLCKGAAAQVACQAAAGAYPHVLSALAAGGQLMLSDGERLDSYARVLRWLNNRALVRERSIDGAREAMGRGRSYSVFAVLGEPGELSFRARSSAGELEMGDQGPAAGATLVLRTPDRPRAELGAQWSAADAGRAGLHAILWRTTSAGRELVGESRTFAETLEVPSAGPGMYSVEVRVVPHHLDKLVDGAAGLLSYEYRWVLMNAISLR